MQPVIQPTSQQSNEPPPPGSVEIFIIIPYPESSLSLSVSLFSALSSSLPLSKPPLARSEVSHDEVNYIDIYIESTETEKHQAKSINRFPLSANILYTTQHTSCVQEEGCGCGLWRRRRRMRDTQQTRSAVAPEWSQLRSIQQRHMNQRVPPPSTHPPSIQLRIDIFPNGRFQPPPTPTFAHISTSNVDEILCVPAGWMMVLLVCCCCCRCCIHSIIILHQIFPN